MQGWGLELGSVGVWELGKAKELGEGEVRERWRWSWVWELGGEGKKGRERVKRVGGEGTRVVCESGCGVCGCGSVGWSRFGFMFMELWEGGNKPQVLVSGGTRMRWRCGECGCGCWGKKVGELFHDLGIMFLVY